MFYNILWNTVILYTIILPRILMYELRLPWLSQDVRTHIPTGNAYRKWKVIKREWLVLTQKPLLYAMVLTYLKWSLAVFCFISRNWLCCLNRRLPSAHLICLTNSTFEIWAYTKFILLLQASKQATNFLSPMFRWARKERTCTNIIQ
jgi:hypothetical protein